MKHNYFMYILLFLIIMYRNLFINSINNIGYIIFNNKDNLTIKILNEKINYLENEYNDLLSFNNKVSIKYDYSLTNIYKDNYGYDKLLINGKYSKGDKVVNSEGLIGIVSNSYNTYSEVEYIYKTHIPVKINNKQGKIVSYDQDKNLIINEIVEKVDINDKVYTVDDIFIGKVISIKDKIIDQDIIVKTINIDNINYVGVISR